MFRTGPRSESAMLHLLLSMLVAFAEGDWRTAAAVYQVLEAAIEDLPTDQ